MDSRKLINFSEVSIQLTGNKDTIRANRQNAKYSAAVNELVDYLDGWISRNSKSKEASITIKTKV